MTFLDIFDADTWTFLIIFGAIWISLVSFGYLWWHLIFLVAFGYLWLRCDARRWRTYSRKCKYRSLRPTLPRIRPLAKKTAGTSLKLCFRKIFSIVDKMISKKYAHPTILIWGTALGNRTPLHNREAAICCNIIELQFIDVNVSKVFFFGINPNSFMRKPVSLSSTLQHITFCYCKFEFGPLATFSDFMYHQFLSFYSSLFELYATLSLYYCQAL